MAKRTLRQKSTAPVEQYGPVQIEPWEHDGITYHKGDPIRISDEEGKFTFMSAQVEKSGRTTISVFWIGRHYRAFYAERVIDPKAKKESVCPEHPAYGAVRRPRSGCSRCEAAYEAKQERKKKSHGEV